MFTIDIILHPTDFSIHSQLAFEMACSMANQHQARVILLHVAPPQPTTAAPTPYTAETVQPAEIDEEKLRSKLDAMRSDKPDLTIDYVLERGNPSEVILHVAKDAQCDTIVMGTHGRTGVSRLLMGSVAEYVVRRAPCPVITVKETMPAESAIEAESANTTTSGE